MKPKTKKKERWLVLSPDGLPQQERYPSAEAARAFIPEFCARFAAQGYYFNARQERIPLDVLPHQLRVMTEHEFFTGERPAVSVRQIEQRAKKQALEYLNTNRIGMGMAPIRRVERLWWKMYRAEWIANATTA